MKMKSFTIYLFWLYLFSEDHRGCCSDIVWQPPKPTITHLKNVSDKQSLLVSWLVNYSSSVGDINEIQISRTNDHIIIYNKNVSARSVGSHKYEWTWISDLPLECVDHFVRVRYFYNQSVPSLWSEWKINTGKQVKETEVFPAGRMLREGSNATFCCVPSARVNITKITLSNQEYPLISLGTRTKAITVENLRYRTKFVKLVKISCSDSTGKNTSVLNFVSLPPQKPRNLSCATSYMTTVTCTWDPGREQHTDRNKQTYTLHIDNVDLAPIECQTSSCTFPSIPQLNEYNITVVVKDKLGEEAESYSFNISDRVFPVAEWDSVSPGVTDSTISWTIQGNLTQMKLFCQLTINTKGTTELNCSSRNGTCKVKVEHLLPNTRYSTRVRCSANGRLWGKWTQPLSFTTYPLVALNLWRKIKHVSDPHTQVTLLWKMNVSGSATTVTANGYSVQWWKEGKSRTEWMDGEQTQAEVSIGPQQCDFTVRADIHNGSSIPAHITIPKLVDRETRPEEKRLKSSSAGGFNLSWSEWDEVSCGYTVEWCILGNVDPCYLQWERIPNGNTLFLPAGYFKPGCRYTFNIYGCTENGDRLLEIQTGYSKELGDVPPPTLVEPVKTTFSSVTLEWHYNESDPSLGAFITGYLVTVKEVGSNMQPATASLKWGEAAFCVLSRWNMLPKDQREEPILKTFKKNTSVDDPQMKSKTIEDLKHSHEYILSVSALTKEGPGQQVSITIRTNNLTQLPKILTFILFALGCTILLYSKRKLLKRRLTEIFVYPAGMNIKPISFLPQAGEMVLSEKMEECISCEIEVLYSHHPLDKRSTHLFSVNTPNPSSQPSASSSVPVQDCCPLSVTPTGDGPAPQKMISLINKSYLHPVVGDSSETQQEMTPSEAKPPSFDLSDCQKNSCTVFYDYVSNDTPF